MKENTDLLYSLPLYHFKSYLELENWTLVNENNRWVVFEDNDAIELAIPKNSRASDYRMYIDHLLKTLSYVQDKEPTVVADDILYFDLDILGALLDDSPDATSISLRSADAHFAELKQLILYSASSEERPEPFIRRVPRKAKNMLDHFKFGHTFRGSFGYRIESRFKGDSHTQLNMFEDDPEPIVPDERKVLQRIYRGLTATSEAVTKDDMTIISDGYTTGLNANMCTAIMNMSGGRRDPIEYSFKWSKKLTPSEELATIPKIRIDIAHLELLESASEHLFRQDPEHTSIVGYVTDLSHRDEPESDELGAGAITIQRVTRDGRSQKVHVVVGAQAHLSAIEAYKDGRTVGVSGYLEYKSSRWRLTDPDGFRIFG